MEQWTMSIQPVSTSRLSHHYYQRTAICLVSHCKRKTRHCLEAVRIGLKFQRQAPFVVLAPKSRDRRFLCASLQWLTQSFCPHLTLSTQHPPSSLDHAYMLYPLYTLFVLHTLFIPPSTTHQINLEQYVFTPKPPSCTCFHGSPRRLYSLAVL